jgi:ATP-dependent exoDNAse (exonuclease V) alpha subunit
MAIYHLSVKPISRKGGRSATAAAAYRSAEIVHDQTTGQVFDYTRKRGVEHSEIVLPLDAVKRDIQWARDRQALWNAAEQAENRSNSRVAREYEVALPCEIAVGERVELVRHFSQSLADRYGCAADFSIHAAHREGDERNYHAHILTTTRTIEATGLGAKTTMEWSDGNRQKAGLSAARDEITAVREQWAELTNEHLQAKGLEARIDHRSLEAQGIEREATIHLGPAVASMQRRGLETDVGQRLELEASARLERAAEIGRLEREGQEVEQSILVLSTDIGAALRARDQARSLGQEAGIKDAKVAQKTQAAQTLDVDPKSTEERRQLAAERWLAYRQGITAGKSPAQARQAAGLEIENERSQTRHLDLGLDATDDD